MVIMKTCPHCGVPVSESDPRCWYCDGDLKNDQHIDTPVLQDFLRFPEEVRDIIGEYGRLLEKLAEEGTGKLLHPISELPYSKEKIEKALRAALTIAKEKSLRNHLETVLLRLGDFIADDEVPDDPEENLRLWLRSRVWKNSKVAELFARTLTQHFVKEYGDKEEQKVEEFLNDLRKSKS